MRAAHQRSFETRREARAFGIVIAASVAFVVLTVLAMVLYPGGRVGDRDARGYSFFANFFSDLGQTHTHSGAPNLVSLVLFCAALVAMATGLGVFFITFARLFGEIPRAARLARIAAACGIIAAICFLGVAATPWNHFLALHNAFVMWAFRALLAAIVLDTVAAFITPRLPRRFGYVFCAFTAVLAAYVVLLTAGPLPNTAAGALVQATGQKIIVYASVLTVLVQSWTARSLLRPERG